MLLAYSLQLFPMTAYNPRTDSPAGIVTLEQNLVHNLLLAHHLHANDTYSELGGGILEKLVQMSIIESANKDIRLIGRFSAILSPSYATAANQKFWMNVLPWANATVPPAFKTDT